MAKQQQQQQQNGGGGSENNMASATTTPKKQQKQRSSHPFLNFLRTSFRRAKQPAAKKTATESGEGQNNGGLLSPSRTFDATTSTKTAGHCRSPPQHQLSAPDRFCPSLSPAPSGCYSEPIRSSGSATDGQLDRSLMQTCTDVKYENRRRPKFAAVVDANFQRQCLQAHNHVRQIYACPPLLWSQELAELAKSWALKLAQRGRLLYPELPGIGENIFLLAAAAGSQEGPAHRQQQQQPSTTGDHLTTGTELVALWAAEARQLDFGRPTWRQDSSHFTQMVWRGSVEMGVARHWNMQNDCLAIVAFYRPAGNCNLPGEFAANLPSREEVPDGAFDACTLQALSQALNRADLGDGGFRKGPSPRHISCPPNSTKILKS